MAECVSPPTRTTSPAISVWEVAVVVVAAVIGDDDCKREANDGAEEGDDGEEDDEQTAAPPPVARVGGVVGDLCFIHIQDGQREIWG